MEPGSSKLILLLIGLLCLSAYFSAAETSLISLSKIRLRNMVDENVKNAEKIKKLLDNQETLLGSILVGNNLVNIGASAIATAIAMEMSPDKGVGIATGIMTFVILVFGEITPKTISAQNTEKIAIFVAPGISFIVKLFTPVVFVLNGITKLLLKIIGMDNKEDAPMITESEFKTLVTVGHEEGLLETDEKRMINNVFDFGDSKAKDIMTPRTDITAVPDDASYPYIMAVFEEERLSRIPVYHDDIDTITGIIHLKDIAFIKNKEDFCISEVMREPFFTYESKSVAELFNEMRTERIPIAIILDEYGGTSGLITIEDLVEEIVGDISDEYDEVGEEIEAVKDKDNEYLIDGSTRIDDVNEMIGTSFESEDFETIGGYVIGILDRFPETGESFENDGVKITVEEADKNRIEKVRIKV